MLNHYAVGPTTSGNFLTVYMTPGCNVPTVACLCSTKDQASTEAKRLNDDQAAREEVIRRERELCGLRDTSHAKVGK